jgi:hypothetical protein
MLHQFRLATGFSRSSYDTMFVHRSDIVRERLGSEDTLVLLDDFVGTGQQVATAWNDAYGELVAGIGSVYLLVVAAREQGVEFIRRQTGLPVQSAVRLNDSDNIFSDACIHFTNAEKEIFKRYCKKANRKEPAGFGECGLLVVFSHRCPNDSVAALHACHRRWYGLFPRNDQAV